MTTDPCRGSVLAVDDDPALSKVIAALLRQSGIECEGASSADEALTRLTRQPFDAVVTDLRMPGMDGMRLLSQIGRRWPAVPVIVLTAHGTVPLAVDAMRLGAADFILKPFDRDQLLFVVNKALQLSRSSRDRVPPVGPSNGALVGASEQLRAVEALVRRVAPSMSTILVRGETGTGKELIARAIHANSPLASKPFVKVDCASLPDSLLESELFGYERGAFTGATCRKPGRVELAQGGTLFLDEIGEITLAVQKKLLRLLQDREFERLGGVATIKADIRVVAATHRNLEVMISAGEFREDLFYRLNVVPVHVPPLRERSGDVRALALHFAALAANANRVPEPRFDESALETLQHHPWPGNVRQLQHFVERLVVTADSLLVNGRRVASELSTLPRSLTPLPARLVDTERPGSLDEQRRTAERDALVSALERANGNRTLAARLLGVSRRSLHYKLKEHQID
jgi:two-component system response regulator AtoC